MLIMIIPFSELRTKTGDILRALNRHESVTLLYRGKPKAIMSPVERPVAREQAGFGMWADRQDMDDVEAYVCNMRKVDG